jgi:protein-tyrosine phosphatase
MIDLHTHVLPGIDDGPVAEAAAIELARAAVASGATALVATPHIDHVYRVDPQTLPARTERLRALCRDSSIRLRIHQGAEIAPSRIDELSDDDIDILRLGGGPYILLECPFTDVGDAFPTLLFRIHLRGLRVVLAHPERSPAFLRRRQLLEQFVAQGAKVQITADSVTGRFGREIQGFALDILASGLVHVVSSDAHAATGRAPGVDQARDAAQRTLQDVDEHWMWWTHEAPAAILSGAPLGAAPRLRRSSHNVLRRIRRH